MKKIRVTVLLCVFILTLVGCQSESDKSEEKKEVNMLGLLNQKR